MPITFAPCFPIAGTVVPAMPEWFHEIKYDGYRLIVIRNDKRVRLITPNGADWSGPRSGVEFFLEQRGGLGSEVFRNVHRRRLIAPYRAGQIKAR
jgi:ATP-dependent DNA ligase